MSRTYSAILLNTTLAATTGVSVATLVVPNGHTWVVRHIAVAGVAGAYADCVWQAYVVAPSAPGAGTNNSVFAFGMVIGSRHVSEWEGRAVIPTAATLGIVSVSEFGLAMPAVTVVMSGYDLIG